MFDRISNGFAMARSSWAVLMGDKKLLLYPIVSGILSLIVFASFVIPLGMLFEQNKLLDANGQLEIWVYPILFAFYFLNYFVVIFCNAALVSCAILRFNGEPCTIGDGFRAAMSRLPQIVSWAFVSATVGLLLKLVENVHEKAGEIIASLLGAGWSLMTYFVVPILVVEKAGPFEAVSRSMHLLKKTWGEAVVGKIGLGLFFLLAFIPVVVLFALGIYLLSQSVTLGLVLIGAAAICTLIFLAATAAMTTIFLTAIYQYAAFDRVPEGFDAGAMAHAFARQ